MNLIASAVSDEEDEYLKGVIFYIKDDVVVGVVLWNLDGFTWEPTLFEIGRQVSEYKINPAGVIGQLIQIKSYFDTDLKDFKLV